MPLPLHFSLPSSAGNLFIQVDLFPLLNICSPFLLPCIFTAFTSSFSPSIHSCSLPLYALLSLIYSFHILFFVEWSLLFSCPISSLSCTLLFIHPSTLGDSHFHSLHLPLLSPLPLFLCLFWVFFTLPPILVSRALFNMDYTCSVAA